MLDTTYVAPKIENNRFCQRHKHQKEKIIASDNDINTKKQKEVLLSTT